MSRRALPSPTRPKRQGPGRKRPAGAKALLTRAFTYPDAQHPIDVYLGALGSDSARVMGSALESVADIMSGGTLTARAFPWHQVRSEHVAALRGRLQKLYAPSSANRYLTALRSVMKAAWRLELLDHETMERSLDVAPIKGSRELRGRAVSRRDVERLFRTCATDLNRPAGTRDAAILALLYGSGIRRTEAVLLDVADLDHRQGKIVVRGKGNKERVVFLPSGTLQALKAWSAIRGTDGTALFCRVYKNGRIDGRRISAMNIYLIVQKRHAEAGVESFTPHDLRRSFISELLTEGVDIATVARQVGHSNVQTTARYDRRNQQAQRAAVQRLDVPFRT